MADSYKIVRFYFKPTGYGRHSRVITRGLTLEEAQEHCRDPESSSKTCTSAKGKALMRRYGKWFDGYDRD
jgi:hypothetical protein